MKNNRYNLIKKLSLSGFLLVTVLLFSGFNPGYSQITVVSGTTVKVNAASSLSSSMNVVLNPGGALNVQGTLILKKDLENGNATPNSLGTGSIVFSGTTAQSISGQNVIQDLTMNNAAGLTVVGETRVNGALALTSGLVNLGANLVLGTDAAVTGGPSVTSMVVANPGELRKAYDATHMSFIYPVGDATGPANEYSPVTLTFNSGTFGAGSYAGVSVVDEAYAGTAGSYLTRYWNVTQSGITGVACNTTFQYVPADVVGAETDIYCFKVNPTPFTAYNPANTGAHTIDAHGLASFSTFTGNLGNGSTPPEIRSIQDQTITTGPLCADAGQTMLIAGNGTTYEVHTGGSVSHVAGMNIIYYPGTKVDGGYMHGYISTTFCNPTPSFMSTPVITGIENPGTGNQNNSFFKIYPNPTPGKFTLELNGDVTAAQVHVEIFGILGERILSRDMQIDRKQEFSLTEKPTGVYVVHVTSGMNSETEKIIKR